MAQMNVVEMVQGIHTLATNPEARRAMLDGLSDYWNALKSGDAVVWGKTLFEVATIFIAVDDVAKAAKLTKVSQASSLLSKGGVFAKNLGKIALTNAKTLVCSVGKTLVKVKSTLSDVFSALAQKGKVLVSDFASAVTAGGKKFTQAIDNLAASLLPPQYAFAGVGDSQSLFGAMSRNADEVVELTDVQKNFRAVMAEASGEVGSKLNKSSADGYINNVPEATVKHADLGEFNSNNRLINGGHGQSNIDYLKNNKIKYNIVKEYPNGVRVGNIPSHKNKMKRTGTGQSWFPKSWSDNKIRDAGNYVNDLSVNKNLPDGQWAFGEYDGVRIGIIKKDGKLSTIIPDNSRQP